MTSLPVSANSLPVSDFSEKQLIDVLLGEHSFDSQDADDATGVGLVLLGAGDDAAQISAPQGNFLVASDVLIEDQHFKRSWSSPAQVARRALIQNFADIYAMGGQPTVVLLTLALPKELPFSWLTQFAHEFRVCCAENAAVLVGGDLSASEKIVVSITAHGQLNGNPLVKRSGAQIGDVLAHAGVCGFSAAGLEVLKHREEISLATGASGKAQPGKPDARWQEFINAFLVPQTDLKAGLRAAVAGASAMQDVSDGLVIDAGRIAAASGVVIELDDLQQAFKTDLATLAPVCAAYGLEATELVLGGGEDHGFLATFAPGQVLPEGFTKIGRVRAGSEKDQATKVFLGEKPLTHRGWDHFSVPN